MDDERSVRNILLLLERNEAIDAVLGFIEELDEDEEEEDADTIHTFEQNSAIITRLINIYIQTYISI